MKYPTKIRLINGFSGIRDWMSNFMVNDIGYRVDKSGGLSRNNYTAKYNITRTYNA